ncbi:c-type cytochrome [Marinobacter sp. S0848L]|uniref:c-type cytochrome n=1 Tax=Marinobacter sp. S0848L TaxID=2926423 RepID=UPI001FF3CF56|nr:c-type cytochrome [Marinobacter sp. S0848L]MCK0107300.1 c-type cytochrome [Marinobacter sp. S0848L]
MIFGLRVRHFLVVAGMSFSAMVQAESTDVMSELRAIMADDQGRQAAYEAGQERIRFCGYCHGKDGNSKRDYIPNLAAQHPQYLFDQFEKFGNGTREDYVMSKLAKTLSVDEQINIAVYFSQQKAKARPSPNPALVDAGESLFKTRCAGCHGQKAQGFQNMPRLAGQPAEYLGIALNRFKQMDPTQHSTPMIGIATVLSDEDIESLAAYLTTQ